MFHILMIEEHLLLYNKVTRLTCESGITNNVKIVC